MSDEVEFLRQPGVLRDAPAESRKHVNALIAQNQALQEENANLKNLDEHAEWERAELWRDQANALGDETRALQERIEELEAGVWLGLKFARSDYDTPSSVEVVELLSQLLSPTQETEGSGER